MTKNQVFPIFTQEATSNYRIQQFFQTDIGKLHQAIPFKALAKLLPVKRTNSGAPSWFGYEGYFGLMFLKAYLGLSDEKLIARINTDWALQLFCGIRLGETEMIKDADIPSRARIFLGEHLDIESFQRVMLENWHPYMEEVHCHLNDATVYESYVKYPTDVKLLWDCCVWVYETLYALCKQLGIRRPRSKYKEQQLKQVSYQRIKKKGYKQSIRRKRALLYLLNKGLDLLKPMVSEHEPLLMSITRGNLFSKLSVIYKVYRQQKYMYDNRKNEVQDRVVSFFKPYLRPIVRGKENKRVEFGAKITMGQVDRINMIDKLSFDPYNEAVYLKNSIFKHKERFGYCHQIGIDQIYGTNVNRKFMREREIFHCLVRKGKPSVHEQQLKELRKHLGRQRATVLEGSFGNEKNHYNLKKIKARCKETEITWILFGVWTANVVKIAKRKQQKAKNQQAA